MAAAASCGTRCGIQCPPARLASAELQKIVGGFAPPPLGRPQLAATEQHQAKRNAVRELAAHAVRQQRLLGLAEPTALDEHVHQAGDARRQVERRRIQLRGELQRK